MTAERAARCFRRALEELHAQLATVTFENFPHGSCGDAAELLGQYLSDSGLGEWQYVSGVMALGDGIQSLAWVEQDGLIVDITADQFEGVNQAVLVTRDRSWHRRFRPEEKHVANLCYYVRDDNNRAVNADYLMLKRWADGLKSSAEAL